MEYGWTFERSKKIGGLGLLREICSLQRAAAAKSLQLCPTLCDPIDGSPPGSPPVEFSRQEWRAGQDQRTLSGNLSQGYLAINNKQDLESGLISLAEKRVQLPPKVFGIAVVLQMGWT